jgi:serine/alanine adding enzyme
MKASINLPDIYFLPEWGELYQEHDKAEVGIFEFQNKLGHVYYQFMKRPLPEELGCKDYVDLVTPYGFNGPLVLDCSVADRHTLATEFDEAFQQYCLQEHIVSEYIRFNPWLRNHLDFETIYTTKYNNYTLFTNLTVHDFYLEEFSSKTRNHIRKAVKSGVQIEFDFSGSSINEFHHLYQKTIKKNNVFEYYLFDIDFLMKTFNALKNEQFIINAIFEGKYISSAIFLHYGDYIHYHLAANDPRYYPLCANSLILHEACKWGQSKDKKQLHLGGAFSEELFIFKKGFTKNGICDYYVGEKIRNETIYNEFVNNKIKNGTIKNPSYFPLYRG